MTIQLCIVLEATTTFFPHKNEIFQHALEPILEVISELNTYTEYGVILFKGYQYSDFLVQTFPFTSNKEEFKRVLTTTEFSGGGSFHSAASEGLAACVQDMLWREEAEKHCILICIKPYLSPCKTPGECFGKSAVQIAQILAQKRIILSCVSPFHHKTIKDIFDAGHIQDVPIFIENDKPFLMYLRGIQLQKTNSPPQIVLQRSQMPSVQPTEKISPVAQVPTSPMNVQQKPEMLLELNLLLQNQNTPKNLCKFQVYSPYAMVDKSKLFLEHWPKNMILENKLPYFNSRYINAALQHNSKSLCIWIPVPTTQQEKEAYKMIITRLIQKHLCALIKFSPQSGHGIVLFPYVFYAHLIKKQVQNYERARLASLILPSSYIDRIEALMKNSQQQSQVGTYQQQALYGMQQYQPGNMVSFPVSGLAPTMIPQGAQMGNYMNQQTMLKMMQKSAVPNPNGQQIFSPQVQMFLAQQHMNNTTK